MEVAGEVAEAWGHWLWTAEPLPRHAELWDQQFDSNEQNYEALANLRFEKDGSGDLMVHPAVFRTQDGVNGRWHSTGGGITLSQLFSKFGKHYWYYNAKHIGRKKKHPWGSVEGRKSALQRWKTLGRPGHQSRPASNRPSAI